MSVLSLLLPGLFKTIDNVVDSVDDANKMKAKLQTMALNNELSELETAAKIIIAEASGGWLQKNWRPMLMIWFAGLVGAHWLGFTPPNLSEDVVMKLLSIVQVGIGGYIMGRSAEKIMKEYKKKD